MSVAIVTRPHRVNDRAHDTERLVSMLPKRITNRDPKTGRILPIHTNRTCRAGPCRSPTRTRGYCSSHYAQWKKWGNPFIYHKRGVRRRHLGLSDEERLLSRFVERIDWGVGCWPARGKVA